jgi:hypothetical protein
VIDAVAPVPVIAAGGVADGRGLAAVLALVRAATVLRARWIDQWSPERGPQLLDTVWPGIFAAGDVRAGATKRVVGDGAGRPLRPPGFAGVSRPSTERRAAEPPARRKGHPADGPRVERVG